MYNGPHRKSQRLKYYDYSQDGMYFVTFCCYKKQCFLGDIVDGKMVLKEYGKIVEKCWFEIPRHYDNVELDGFVIMPNHVHGIVKIVGQNQVGTEYILSLQGEHSEFFKLLQIYLNSQDTFNTFRSIQDKRTKIKAEKNNYIKNSCKTNGELKNYFFQNYYPK